MYYHQSWPLASRERVHACLSSLRSPPNLLYEVLFIKNEAKNQKLLPCMNFSFCGILKRIREAPKEET